MKRLYLTKQEAGNMWSYIGDPLHPNTTLDVGLVSVDLDEIRVDQFGVYVERLFI